MDVFAEPDAAGHRRRRSSNCYLSGLPGEESLPHTARGPRRIQGERRRIWTRQRGEEKNRLKPVNLYISSPFFTLAATYCNTLLLKLILYGL